MQKRVPALAGVVVVETALLLCFFLRGCSGYRLHYHPEEYLREDSPDGRYTLVIWERAYPDWPFGSDHLEISFFSKENYGSFRMRFEADVANDGAPARYQVKWTDMGVQITLSGEEQPDAVYILPYPLDESVQEEATSCGTC